ncbi:MAG: ATP-binding protein [bacterium]
MGAFLQSREDQPGLKSEYALDKAEITVGRHPSNDIPVPLESVSRFHAKLEIHKQQHIVTDLRSSNGTYVNGHRIQAPTTLQHGDLLAFGNVEFYFSREPSDLPPTQKGLMGKRESEVALLGEEEGVSTILKTRTSSGTTSIPGIEAEEGIDLESLKKVNSRLITLYQLNDLLRTTSDPEEMLNRVMKLVFKILPADRGVIMRIVGEDTSSLTPAATRFRDETKTNSKISISKTIVDRCVVEKVAVLSRDAQTDARFAESESIILHNIRSAMCVPLISKNKVLGIFHIDTQESVRAFNEDDLTFFSSIATELSVSLDNLLMTQDIIRSERLAAVGQTITGLAHNIKNILLLTRGGMELMDKCLEKEDFENLTDNWGIVKRGVQRINNLTKDMLDYSRARKVQLKKVHLNQMIEEIAHSFSEEFEKKNVKATLDLDPAIPERLLDEDGLYKTLMNLLVNSLEAMTGPNSEIIIRTALKPDEGILLTFQDNGTGISKENLLKIFMPFFSTKGSKGTGLGLPMSKKVVEDMGGTISVDSVEGEGTTFTINLPPHDPKVRFDVQSDTN